MINILWCLIVLLVKTFESIFVTSVCGTCAHSIKYFENVKVPSVRIYNIERLGTCYLLKLHRQHCTVYTVHAAQEPARGDCGRSVQIPLFAVTKVKNTITRRVSIRPMGDRDFV